MIGGTSVKAFPVPPLPSLSEMAEGTLVKLNESGAPVEFYVAKHDYESELNGAGRTLVVRKDCYDQRRWHSANTNAWATCTLRDWLNGDYKALLDSGIQELIGTTTYRYTPGNGSWSVDTRSDAVFMLSATELGKSASFINVEGSVLSIANILKKAHLNGGTSSQWTRSPTRTSSYNAIYVDSSGDYHGYKCSESFGSRPVFTLPSTLTVDENMNVIGGAP